MTVIASAAEPSAAASATAPDAAATAPDTAATALDTAATSTGTGPTPVVESTGPPTGEVTPGRRLRDLPVVRALTSQSLTAPGGLLVALVVITPGVLIDLMTDATLGAPSTAGFLLAVLVTAAVVRRQALATAAVLPPLLFAAAAGALAWLSGNNESRRELVLDVGTTLALSAPALFAGTAAALAVVLGRLCQGLLRQGLLRR